MTFFLPNQQQIKLSMTHMAQMILSKPLFIIVCVYHGMAEQAFESFCGWPLEGFLAQMMIGQEWHF
jgi:hypothetical protein